MTPDPCRETTTPLPDRWYGQSTSRRWTCPPPRDVSAFHASLPGHAPTPLVPHPALAEELDVGQVLVKDESERLDIGAFKILGASWAGCRAVAQAVGGPADSASVAELSLAGVRRLVEASHTRPVLVTATDGNHGRAVARTAAWLGLQARVVMPAGVPEAAVARIRGEGADVEVLDLSYDDTVRHASALAEKVGGILVQDTAWGAYTEVPGWIVDGYETLFAEIDAAAPATPDLVVVPTGVGSVLQAALAHYRSVDAPSAVLCVEPTTAACVLRSVEAGARVSVSTPGSVMNGLSCGSVSTLAWPYVRDGLDAAVAVTDAEATAAVERLTGLGQTTGPNGASALAGARLALTGDGATERRAALGIDASSTVVLLNTEGFTD